MKKASDRPIIPDMNTVPDSEAQKAMGVRLQAVREALDLTQEEMAQTMGVVPTTLSGWEGGRNQIDIVKLAKAATRWGFTTDWVALGDLSGLRRDLADKVEIIVARGPALRRGRPRTQPKRPGAPLRPTPGRHVKENRSDGNGAKDARPIRAGVRRAAGDEGSATGGRQ